MNKKKHKKKKWHKKYLYRVDIFQKCQPILFECLNWSSLQFDLQAGKHRFDRFWHPFLRCAVRISQFRTLVWNQFEFMCPSSFGTLIFYPRFQKRRFQLLRNPSKFDIRFPKHWSRVQSWENRFPHCPTRAKDRKKLLVETQEMTRNDWKEMTGNDWSDAHNYLQSETREERVPNEKRILSSDCQDCSTLFSPAWSCWF